MTSPDRVCFRLLRLPPKIATVAVIAAVMAPGATMLDAFLIQTAENARGHFQQNWRLDTVPFVLGVDGSADLGAARSHEILRESFAAWQDVSTSRLVFEDRGLTEATATSGDDGVNVVLFDETGRILRAPAGTGVIAVTRITSDLDGRITDADIIFNGRDFRFGEGAQPGRIELRDVAVHEVGHLLGLDHTPLEGTPSVRPTMNPFYHDDGPGEGASLQADDIAGVSTLYPTADFQNATSRISGSVTDIDGNPIFGALIAAENLSSGETYGTVSGAFPRTLGRGDFLLQGLLPGSYRLHLSPISGRIDEDNFSGIFQNFDLGFAIEYFDNVDRVELATALDTQAGGEVSNIEITTGFRRLGHPYIEPLAELANTPSVGSYAVRARVEDAVTATLLARYGPSSDADEPAAGAASKEPTQRLQMDDTGGGLFAGAIPGQRVGIRVFYQLEATNSRGDMTVYPSPNQWLRFDIVPLSGAALAFTAVRQENVVSVLDIGSERELARVRVGNDPIQLVSDHSGRVFVSNLGSSEVLVIESTTFQVVDRIELADEPLDMTLSPDGSTVYVTNSGAGLVTAIDVDTRATWTIPVSATADGPYGVAATDAHLAVTDLRNDLVLIVDSDGAVIQSLPVSGQPRSLARSADGSKLYVTGFRSDVLTVIDTGSWSISNEIRIPVAGGFAVAASPDGARVYATGHEDGVLVIVDAATESVVRSVPVGVNPRAISFSPSGDRLFVTSAGSGQIHVLSTADGSLINIFEVAEGARGIAVVAPPNRSTATTESSDAAIPLRFGLDSVFPNPFNAAVHAVFTVGEPPTSQYDAGGESPIRIDVYNLLGQRVRTLVEDRRPSGRYRVSWDGTDSGGEAVSSGVYALVLTSRSQVLARKMLLLR